MVDKKSVRELFKAIEEQFNFDLVELDRYKEVVNRRRNKSDLIESSVSKQDFDLIQEYFDAIARKGYIVEVNTKRLL